MARAKKHEEHENHERWLVSYADFITLLFAFFVVLYATSSQNEEKEKKFEQSIKAQFKLIGAIGEGKNDSGGMFGQIIDPVDVFKNRDAGPAEIEDSLERLLNAEMTPEERKQSINGLHHDGMGVRISLAAATFFPSGSAKLKLSALKSLDKVAGILKKSGRRLIIEGHTDDQAIKDGSFESNWELASLRATSVVRYLSKYQKIEPKMMAAISYADTKPIAPNDTEENRAKNRRIEILIVNPNKNSE